MKVKIKSSTWNISEWMIDRGMNKCIITVYSETKTPEWMNECIIYKKNNELNKIKT